MPEALIWGASGGIGSALVTTLKGEGWRVYGAARNTAVIPLECDLALDFDADYEHSFEAVTMRVAQEADTIDLMVYAVGDVAYDKLDGMNSEGWRKTIQSNLTGAYLAYSYGKDLMVEGSHSIFIGAYVEHIRLPKMGAYTAAKAGLAEFVTIMQKENRKQRYTLVRPGATDTAFWNKVALKLPADSKKPAEVASAILAHHQSGQNGDLNL